VRPSIPAGEFFHVPESEDLELDDLRVLLRMPGGRRVFRRLLAACNVMGPSMGKDGRVTEYNEGLRACGLWLATKIETASPGDIARLIMESGCDRLAANAKTTTSVNEKRRKNDG
jgi:hypothetical protein